MATLAKNTLLKTEDTPSGGVYTSIAGITSIAWDGQSWNQESTTSHDSATPVETMQPTTYSNGKITLSILWNPSNTQHALLRTLSQNGAARNFTMVQVNSAETDVFVGYVTGFGWDTSVNGLLKAKVTISISGAFA